MNLWCRAWVAAALGIGSSAPADVVTFESLAGQGNPQHSDLTVEGYEFTTDTFFTTIDSDPSGMYVHDGSKVTLARGYGWTPVTMRRADGAPFDLVSFDAGGVFNHPWNGGPSAKTLHLTGLRAAGGTVTLDLPLGISWGQPFVHLDCPGMTGLVGVTFDGSLPNWPLRAGFQLDNIATAVPVPGTPGFVAAAVLAITRRRRG